MTRRARLERKLELRREWAESRKSKASQEWDKADLSEEKTGIPLGQPILVGHHSEGKHRRLLERSDNAMRRGHEHIKMSEHHLDKAEGLETVLDSTIFSDDPDAEQQLLLKIEKLEAERKKNNAFNKIMRSKKLDKSEKVKQMINLGLSEGLAGKAVEHGSGLPSYVNQNLGGRISAAKKRILVIQATKQRKEMAVNSENGILIQGGGGYIRITFAEKPDREVINSLKVAGFHWNSGSWNGSRKDLPDSITGGK